ncbi:MAG TPA: HAD hydrolase family protein [Gemmatimonadales bacterium]|jgi:3-deoxy-D-manno-octulosonate 8-phosphate phosphatase (KDO 8-P phosphatase)
MEIDAARAARVRMLALDVDGVLTDNGIWIGPVAGERVELKRFDIQDGLGLRLLRTAGLPVLWLSGRHSEATALRAEELRVDELLQVPGPKKLEALAQVLSRRGLDWQDVAYVGDDLADLQIMRRAGLPIAVANAVPEIRAVAAAVTTARGGHGAVREIADALLKARGVWADMLERYFTERATRDA